MAPLAALAQNQQPSAPFRDGVVLVGYKNGVPGAQQQAIAATVGAAEVWTRGAGVHLLRVPPGQVSRVIAALLKHPEVRYAEPDYLQHADGLPNDPSFYQQWGLQNAGQTVNGVTGTAGADERAVAAWSVTTGSRSVVVAVLDTGVDYTHPDLAPNMWSNPGGVNGCAAGTHGYNVLNNTCDPMDNDTTYGGHGTHVAGIIGAAGNNGVGVTGVNWTVSIMGVKWLSSESSGFTSDLISAMSWVVKAKQAGVNVRVVNDSSTWPGTAYSQALSDEIDALTNADILFVAAAGNTAQNNDTTPRYPCSYARPGEICVAASDSTDHLWSSSNWGATTVNLAAPGVNIYSTLIGGAYGFISGGSMACAQVSGAAALMLSQGYQQVISLRANVLSSVDALPAFSGLVSNGGRLDICKGITGCTYNGSGPPANTSLPTISGSAVQGQMLSATAGTWSGGSASYAYQWNRCNSTGASCSPITGATSGTYTILAAADIGATLSATVTATNSSGSASATSAPTGVVASATSAGWSVTSSVTNGESLCGTVTWQAFPSITGIASVAFYIDGSQQASDSASPYSYSLNTTSLAAGSHVFAIAATATDGSLAYATANATTGGSCAGNSSGIALVQSAATIGTGVTSLSQAFPKSNAAGDLAVAFLRMSGTSQTVTVTDSAGNTYAQAAHVTQTSDGHQIYVFYAKNIAGNTNTVTATFSGTNNHPWLAIYEYSGLSTTNPVDQVAQAQGGGTVADSGATPTTAAPNELVFAGVGLPASWSGQIAAATGFALLQQSTAGSPGANEGQMVTATGSYDAAFTLTSSANWSAVVVTFAAAGSNTGPAPLSVSTSSLPDGTVNKSYSAMLTASGGTASYNWSIVNGSLPPGLSLNASTGAITGTPATSGQTSFTVQAADSGSPAQTATKALSISIAASNTSTAIGLAQSASAEGSGVTSVSAAFPAANTAGNMIIAFVRMSSTSQTVSITDTAGNVYTQAVSAAQSSDGHQIFIFYAPGIKGGANTVTASFSATNNHPWLAVYEYSGLSALDRTSQAAGSSNAPNSGLTATTGSANELVFSGLGLPSSSSATVSAVAGYALALQDPNQFGSRAATENATVGSTGTYAGMFSLSGSANWSCVVATFKP